VIRETRVGSGERVSQSTSVGDATPKTRNEALKDCVAEKTRFRALVKVASNEGKRNQGVDVDDYDHLQEAEARPGRPRENPEKIRVQTAAPLVSQKQGNPQDYQLQRTSKATHKSDLPFFVTAMTARMRISLLMITWRRWKAKK